ncbi:MAG: protein-L-isoaspartate(D-aspartate) O-methyltransferase [Bacteroidota bacterium]
MRTHEDTYRHKGLRKKLVDLLKEKGITDERVLDAIGIIPRHFFLDSAFDEVAYEDRAFPIEVKQTISQPYTVAYQTQLLDLQPHEKILEIGTGSAYQCSVLAEMGAKVFTIERQKQLFDNNKDFKFIKKYSNIKFFYGDGYEGLPTYAPFDKVIITAASKTVPPKLIAQLKTGGKMIIPLGASKDLDDAKDEVQKMMRYTKQADGSITEETFSNFSFVPMRPGKEK